MANKLKDAAKRIADKLVDLDDKRLRIGLEGKKILERLDPETANMAKNLWDDPRDTADWFTKEVESLGWQTPWRCIAKGRRKEVQRILDSIAYGLPA